MNANIPNQTKGLTIEAVQTEKNSDGSMNISVSVTANCETINEELYMLETSVLAVFARIFPRVSPPDRRQAVETFNNRIQAMLYNEVEEYSKQEMLANATNIAGDNNG